jgi:hypothetical protein
MVIGFEGSYRHPQNGMTFADMKACCNVANRLDEVIIFRSTGPWSKRWLERKYPSKNFHVKGKSSDWGPHAGLVPYDGRLSKVGYDATKAAKGTHENDKGIASGFAIKKTLLLTFEQIKEQLTRPEGDPQRTALQSIHELQNGDYILIGLRSGDRKTVAFRAVKSTGGLFEIWVYPESAGTNLTKLTFEVTNQPLEVMASAEIGGQKPMTGDYDLMAICPTMAQYGSLSSREISKAGIQLPGRLVPGQKFAPGVGMDNVMDPSLHTMGTKKSNWGAMNAKGTKLPPKDAHRNEHPDMGNLTPRILRCINELNAAMGATGSESALRRIHHNAESHRNAMFGALTENDMVTMKDGEKYGDGFPLTGFQPSRIANRKFGDVCTVETLIEFREYAADLYRAGFYVPRNWIWNMMSQLELTR